MRALSRGGDFWSGLALAALGTYIVSEAWGWSYMTEDGPGPGFFPLWYGSLMVVLALVLVVRSAVAPARAAAPVRWREVGRALTCWGAFVACIALMKVVGFTVSLALLAWFIIAVMARRPQREAIPIAVAGSAVFYGIFVVLLELNLPQGFLF